ncbi:dTDP-4-dehydrorhamnose 3,5-epimerase [Candidatus Woesearchaeota archaeon]|nr:dTDP-4-dehydrorhamnose 3,5-epimerase [Candidatus Woesearchaeota archaeon]
MEFFTKEIEGVYEIQLSPFEDERGFFMRTYDKKIFEEKGLHKDWVHENHSLSRIKGTVRGLHFQYPPRAETKLLRVVTGEVFFAVVDLRKGSKTFGKWTSVILSGNKKNMLYVPRGCTPGMCTLTDDVHLAYKVDNYYSKENEDNIKWNDPDIGIEWPVKEAAVISERDDNAQSFKKFKETKEGIDVYLRQ